MSIIALFVVLLFTVSANTERAYTAVEGINAPDFKVIGIDGSEKSLSGYRGRYVLVNFWSSTDAESRISAGRYARYAGNAAEERFVLLAVNFDRSERLFREIVRRDGLMAESQSIVKADEASSLIEEYAMAKGLQSFLIDPHGRIAAVNPSITKIASIVGD